jgi:hypothetical protein
MKKINLSDTEKKILMALSISKYNGDMFRELSREELHVASNRLRQSGLIVAHYASENGGMLAFAAITDEGIVYLKENPTLDNPVDENDIRRLKLENLQYEKSMRIWKFLSIIFGISGVIIGWLLSIIKIK